MDAQRIKISKLVPNTGQIDGLPANPRFIKDEKFLKLVKSVKDDPEMLDLRELIVYPLGKQFVVIGGNMRLRAMKEAGFTEAPCKVLDKDTPADKLRAYTAKDNVGFGEWNWDDLANEWDAEELSDWGLDLPEPAMEEDHSDAPASNELYKPYSVINRQADGWPDRSNMLRAMLPNDLGRDERSTGNLLDLTQGFQEWSGNDTGTSIFDPCIAEWCYTMFKPSTVLDPFCGGPSRGYVAAMMGIKYVGFDIRPEQLEVNRQRIDQFGTPPEYVLSCYSKHNDGDTYDMVMTCPPYGDLEVYSDLKEDISNKSPEQFAEAYRAILSKAWGALRPGGHACVVVGNYRRKKKHIDLEMLTKSILVGCGGDIIGDCIIVDPIGSKAMIGGHHLEKYGVVTRCHQYLVVARKNTV